MNSTDFDVVIVGARCAGASTAMLLARHGQHVLLVDRAKLPSEIAHGHFIHRHGPHRLQQWGVLERIVASGCPPVSTLTIDLGDFPLEARDLWFDGVAWGYSPRRGVLDRIMLDAAIEAGVEVHDEFGVEGVLAEGGRVSGIRGRAAHGGAPVSIRARLTIGADGRHSRIAQAVAAPLHESAPTVLCWYFSYWSGAPIDGLEITLVDRRAIFAFPTNDDLTAVFVGFPIAEFAEVRSDPEQHVLAALERAPRLAQRVRTGRREERMYGTADMPNFVRKSCGPGWALVGDAGCHKDPLNALGICDALRDAELLADAANVGLCDVRSLDQALASYELRRNDATLPDFHENLQAARLEPYSRDVLELRAALRGHPADINLFIMASRNMVPREAFFNPENLARIMARAHTAA
jgi:flavin-dependent dehydrogenase